MAIWNRKQREPDPITALLEEHPELRYSFSDYLNEVSYSIGGNSYSLMMTQYPGKGESIDTNFAAYVGQAYKKGGVVFGVSEARRLLFSEVKFCYRNKATGKIYGNPGLALLENPWPNGTTGELLGRMEQDVTLAGNFYARIERDRLRRMQPDRVKILLGVTDNKPPNELNSEIAGYVYYPDGHTNNDKDGVVLTIDEVVHWSPIPDPTAQYLGMSWMTPIIREVQTDSSATDATQKFFDHGMTPNLAVKLPPEVASKEHFEQLRDAMQASHGGAQNAWKTLYLAAGADVTVVGANMENSGVRAVQAASETRIAAAGRCPPVVAGFSEGLQAATYSNYGQARRQFTDGFARPQWRSACAALEKVVTPPAGSELWYDDHAIAFLHEDAREAADTLTTHSAAIVGLVNGGYTSESAIESIVNGDLSFLKHTGLVSVQLQEPGAVPGAVAPDGSAPPAKPMPDMPAPK